MEPHVDAKPERAHFSGTSTETARLRLYMTLAAVDIAAIIAAFGFASSVRFGIPFHPAGLIVITEAVPLYLVLAFKGGAYRIDVLLHPVQGSLSAVRAIFLTAVLLLLFRFTTKETAEYSRVMFSSGFLVSAGILALTRWSVGNLIGRRHGWNFRNEVVLVDRVPYIASQSEIVLFADALPCLESADPFQLNHLGTILAKCERVIVACPPGRRHRWASLLKCFDVDFEILAPELDHLGALEFRSYRAKTTVLLSCGPLALHDRLLKRGVDVVLSATALILLIPVFFVVGVAIRLESPGPILFRQERVGYRNKIFAVLKFRSMYVDQCDSNGTISTTKGDRRVTKVGKLIRALSIDELPQLWNVLRGEMSIVGPRPHALDSTAEDILFWQLDSRYSHRHVVKPGLTGLAQIRGYRGATESSRDLTDRLQADLEYLNGWSLWRDFDIMLRTIRVMAHARAF